MLLGEEAIARRSKAQAEAAEGDTAAKEDGDEGAGEADDKQGEEQAAKAAKRKAEEEAFPQDLQ